jgi:hypothetical protein
MFDTADLFAVRRNGKGCLNGQPFLSEIAENVICITKRSEISSDNMTT